MLTQGKVHNGALGVGCHLGATVVHKLDSYPTQKVHGDCVIGSDDGTDSLYSHVPHSSRTTRGGSEICWRSHRAISHSGRRKYLDNTEQDLGQNHTEHRYEMRHRHTNTLFPGVRSAHNTWRKHSPSGVPALPDGQIRLVSQKPRIRPVGFNRTPESLLRKPHTLPRCIAHVGP